MSIIQTERTTGNIMTYQIKTIYPIEETAADNKLTERKINEYIEFEDSDEVMKYYNSLLVQGFSVAVKFTPPETNEYGEEQDVFAIAGRLELAGIPYKATLKLKASGNYESILKVIKLVEQQGFDYDITAKLLIREESPVDFEKESTWFDTDYAKYTVLPKASSQDIADLWTLYETLLEEHYKVSIDLKAKVKKDDDDVFSTQLLSYPDGTLIEFKLSDADIYGE